MDAEEEEGPTAIMYFFFYCGEKFFSHPERVTMGLTGICTEGGKPVPQRLEKQAKAQRPRKFKSFKH